MLMAVAGYDFGLTVRATHCPIASFDRSVNRLFPKAGVQDAHGMYGSSPFCAQIPWHAEDGRLLTALGPSFKDWEGSRFANF